MINPLGNDLAIVWDLIAVIISLICVLLVVQVNGVLQKSGKFSSIVTRKLVHIFSGPVYVLTWLLYSGTILSRFIAMIAPILFILLFAAIGTGKIKNEKFTNSMARTGDPSELLKGTLYYAIIMLVITILWFYIPFDGIESANPTALVLIGCLSGGDGLADIVGRKYGGEKKFGIKGSQKTLVGSLAMFIGSFLISLILILIMSIEVAAFNIITLILPLLLISLVATIAEAISPKNTDNWIIFVALTLTLLLLSTFAPSFWPFRFLSLY